MKLLRASRPDSFKAGIEKKRQKKEKHFSYGFQKLELLHFGLHMSCKWGEKKTKYLKKLASNWKTILSKSIYLVMNA